MSLRSRGRSCLYTFPAATVEHGLRGVLCYGDRNVVFPLIMQQRLPTKKAWFSFLFSRSKKCKHLFSGSNPIDNSDNNFWALPFLCFWTWTTSLHEKVFLSHYFLVLRVRWLLSTTVPAPCKHGWLSALYDCRAAVCLLVSHGLPLWSSWTQLGHTFGFYSLDIKRPQIIMWNSSFQQ